MNCFIFCIANILFFYHPSKLLLILFAKFVKTQSTIAIEMKNIFGLDLGTTSIGWAVVNEAENDNEQSALIALGERVNPLDVKKERTNFENGKSITINSDRNLKHGAESIPI